MGDIVSIVRPKVIPYGDLLCLAEHAMMGGTSTINQTPWTPYALLFGASLEEVNRQRAGIQLFTSPVFFGLEEPEYGFVDLEAQAVDLETREVGLPRIISVMDKVTGDFLPETHWLRAQYCGPYKDKHSSR